MIFDKLQRYQIKINGGNITAFDFKNANDFVNMCKYDNPNIEHPESTRVKQSWDTFRDMETYEDSFTAVKYGYKTIVDKLNTDLKVPAQMVTKRAKTYDYCGGSVSVGRFLTGEPKCMIKYTKVKTPVEIVNIYKIVTVLVLTTAAEMYESGLNCLKLVKALEREGKKVNLYAIGIKHWGGNGKWACRIKIKDSMQPLNINKIAYYIASPDCARRLIFRLNELSTYELSVADYGSSLPIGYDFSQACDMIYKDFDKDNDIVFDCATSNYFSGNGKYGGKKW